MDIIRSYVPIDYTKNLPNTVVNQYYYQNVIITPALQVLSLAISAYAGVNNTYDPNVLRIYIYNRYLTQQDTIAKVFNVAQRLQVRYPRLLP